jgi:hypothetical protein
MTFCDYSIILSSNWLRVKNIGRRPISTIGVSIFDTPIVLNDRRNKQVIGWGYQSPTDIFNSIIYLYSLKSNNRLCIDIESIIIYYDSSYSKIFYFFFFFFFFFF